MVDQRLINHTPFMMHFVETVLGYFLLILAKIVSMSFNVQQTLYVALFSLDIKSIFNLYI